METLKAEPIGKVVSQWGEGPIWHDGILWYVDIRGECVRRFDPAAEEEVEYAVHEKVGTVVPRRSGGLVIAGSAGISFFDPASGRKKLIADPEEGREERMRFNDGKCDPAGRFWAGTISHRREPEARLYMLDLKHKLHEKLDGITNSNGIVWSADGRSMYYIDTPTHEVRVYNFSLANGDIGYRGVLVNTKEANLAGVPDGMAIDEEDHLWVAMCRGGAVFRFHHKTGEILARIGFPVKNTTACAFGGATMNRLFITAGQSDDNHELDGRLFACDLQIAGPPMSPYAG